MKTIYFVKNTQKGTQVKVATSMSQHVQRVVANVSGLVLLYANQRAFNGSGCG